MDQTFRYMLGQRIALGFHGTRLPGEFQDLIRKYQVGNVILFQRNIESADQLRELCGQIRELIVEVTGAIPFIITTLFLERLKQTFNFIKKHYNIINKISGSILIVFGIWKLVEGIMEVIG